MEVTKNRQAALNKILLRAWRERWTEYQWSINIKSVIPGSMDLDAYNLTEIILEKAVNAGVNTLLLSYLKKSLNSHLISHAAVIKRIPKYSNYEKLFCVKALLDFLISIIDGVTCRHKPEEALLMNAILSLVHWLIEMTENILVKVLETSGLPTSTEQQHCLEKTATLSQKIVQNQFLMGILLLAKNEDRELYQKSLKSYERIHWLTGKHNLSKDGAVKSFHQMMFVDIEQMAMKEFEPTTVEPISFCLQPFMAIEVLVNASADINVHVTKLLMVQRLKNYSMSRLCCEVIRSCFITLCHVKEVNYTVWGAFTLFKIPQILKHLHNHNRNADDKSEYSDDIAKSFDQLMECSPILDQLDTTFMCNSIESMLVELKKQNLISEENCKRLIEKREAALDTLEKFIIPSTPPSLDKYVATMEMTLGGLIQAFREPNKPEFLNLLCTLLTDNRAWILYSVAAVKGNHKTIINNLMKCNDFCKEISGEPAKSKQAVAFRSSIFDITFIMLFSIMQNCGDNFVELTGDHFFEKWVRESLTDSGRCKSPMSIVKMCDQAKVDELIAYFTDNNPQQPPPISMKWHEICMNIPGMLHACLIAWENETISPMVVKGILDNMRMKMCSFAIVAASWLCAYMKVLHEDEQLKPRHMMQQLMKPFSDDQLTKQDTLKERLAVTHEIIHKFVDSRSTDGGSKGALQKPLNAVFNEQWKEITTKNWLPFDAAVQLDGLLKSCGAFWMMNNLVEQIFQSKLIKEMEQTMDIVFAVMHLNIEACTEALLREILPILLLNKNQLMEPQSRVLAKLCVYAILSTIEMQGDAKQKKRPRPDDNDDALSPMAKMRKTGADQAVGVETKASEKEGVVATPLKESLQTCLQDLFKIFHQQVASDEISTKINFVFQFFSLLVQFEKSDKLKPVLRLIPAGLLVNLLKIIPHDELSYGLILRLYDLSTTSGRSSAISDLCLLKNIHIRRESTKL